MPPFIVTGCGRSGTAWAARLFTSLGHPCGHERAYSPWAAGPLDRPDSSWLAVPHLHRLPPSTPIVWVMRDPYRVVQSVMNRGFLAHLDGPYEAYVARHRPSITEAPDHLGRAIRWAVLWDENVPSWPHRLLRVDDADDPDLVEHTAAVLYATGTRPDPAILRGALKQLGRKVNAGPGTESPTRDVIDAHREGWRVRQRAEHYGYGA